MAAGGPMRGPDPYASARDPYMSAGAPGGAMGQAQGAYDNGYQVSQHSGYSTPSTYMGGGAQSAAGAAPSGDMYSRRSPGPMMGAGAHRGGPAG